MTGGPGRAIARVGRAAGGWRLAPAACGALLCTAPIWPRWVASYEGTRVFVRPRQIEQQWLLGHVLPVWSTTAQSGFGSPSLILYHKLFYDTEAAAMLAGLGNGAALLAFLILFMTLGVLLMARAVRVVLGGPHPWIELACGLTAISSNYATTDWLIRGDVAEFAAQMLLPLLFAWGASLIRDGRFSPSIGPIMAAIALAHSGIAVWCFLPIAVLCAAAALRRPRGVAAWIIPGLAAVAVFAAVMAVFVLPALPMLRYAETEWLTGLTPRRSHVPLRAFLLDLPWRMTLPNPGQSLQIDPALLACLAVAPALLLARPRGPDPGRADRAWIAWPLLAIVAAVAFLQTRAAFPAFEILPALGFIQHSWRLLAFLAVAALLVAAIVLRQLDRWSPTACRACCVLLVLSTGANKSWIADHAVPLLAEPPSRADLGVGDPWEYGPRMPGSPADELAAVLRLERGPFRCAARWRSDPHRERARAALVVDCPAAGPTALPLFLAPGMRISSGGRTLPAGSSCADPRVRVTLPAGASVVEIRFPTWWSVVTAPRVRRCP